MKKVQAGAASRVRFQLNGSAQQSVGRARNRGCRLMYLPERSAAQMAAQRPGMGLQWQDVDFLENTITVRHSKTEAVRRVIPLNSAAWGAVTELYRRAEKSSSKEPEHFVFPACENGKIDPTSPQKSWWSAWRSMTRIVVCPACNRQQRPAKICSNDACKADITKIKSAFAGLRFHDLRHHAITELAESQASDHTIMAIAGHVSQEMLQHYSHVRLEAKRRAAEGLSQDGHEAGGYVTKHITNKRKEMESEEVASLNQTCPFRDIGNRTFRRHGLHFSARRGRRGDAMEGEFCDGRTHAVCDPAQGWRDDGFAVPRVRYLA